LFDLALGDVNSATAPQVSLDFVYDFGSSEATQFSYSGTTPFLANWHIGDQVASGNGSNFLSGAVDENPPYNRDNLMSVGTITGTVAEPESGGLVLLGIGLMGVVVCKKAERRLRAG
ncbi:MAG TPA: hypothetical protein VMB75_01550, partial [Rhodocyclaceae bacterium]|nr:hypothetical protein [Rhodocyclaceae bacterium]